MSTRLIISPETGEQIDELFEGDRILRKSSIDQFKQANEMVWNYKSFFKGNCEELKLLIPTLDIYERAILLSILPYVNYSDCLICHSNKREIGLNDIAELSGIGKRKVMTCLDSLIKKDILYKGKNSRTNQYFINPWLVSKGSMANYVLMTMFKNYKIKTRNNVMWKELL